MAPVSVPLCLRPPHCEGKQLEERDGDMWVRIAPLKVFPKVLARKISRKLIRLSGKPDLNIATSLSIVHCTGDDPAMAR